MSLPAKYSVPADHLSFFSSLPCFQHYYQRSNLYSALPFISQHKVENNTSNSFFNETINSPDTIARAVALIHRKALGLTPGAMANNAPKSVASDEKTGSIVNDEADPAFILFVQIGSGLNGFSDTVHGGVLASLIDESLSICVEHYRAELSNERTALYTANLNISYHIPVPTPSVVYVKTWLRQREGRKWFLDAELLTIDGQICVSAKSLWISQKMCAEL